MLRLFRAKEGMHELCQEGDGGKVLPLSDRLGKHPLVGFETLMILVNS